MLWDYPFRNFTGSLKNSSISITLKPDFIYFNLNFMKIKSFIAAFFLSLGLFSAKAEEGLWIPMLLQHYNIDIMQKEGLRLSAEDIYSINQASLKDAILIFGTGCTGEVISGDGLVLTNHHCGYSSIQSHSSVDNDYLTNGFWAMNRDEELPNPGLKVTFLIRIEDVSQNVLGKMDDNISEVERDSIIRERIAGLKKENEDGNGYKAVIKPFYYGNEYYMFIYQEYNDIRLVGAPPSSIGNYGEDWDNWIWPRHTGDFSLFRIYAGADNKPASYSPENTPYKSKTHLKISTAGVKEGDFTMIMGYPGTTTEYIISDEIKFMLETSLPKKVAIRDARLKILDKYMANNDTIRIQYASKYRSISNAWKKWEGVIIGLEKTNALARKAEAEENFREWAMSNPERQSEYGNTLQALRDKNRELVKYSLVYDYSNEAVMAAEIFDFALDCNSLVYSTSEMSKEDKRAAVDKFKKRMDAFFKDYNRKVDQEIFQTTLAYYYRDIAPEFHPDIYNVINKKYKGDINKFTAETFNKTIFLQKDKLLELLDQIPESKFNISLRFQKDPVLVIFNSFAAVYSKKVIPAYDNLKMDMQVLYRSYMRGLMEMQKDKVFYPDANFTMRVAYGKAEGYKPADGIEYLEYTSLSGAIEKHYMDSVVYSLPEKLIEIYNSKDFGRWVNEKGEVPVCFVASNHTSGGNSGSPILNADGYLIGLNFDRNWEGTMSDVYYDVSICRNISVDIRYVLFIIDKFAGAGYLINEMDLI